MQSTESTHTLLLAVKNWYNCFGKELDPYCVQFLSYMHIPHRNVCTFSPKYSKRMFVEPLIIETLVLAHW